MQMNPQDCFCKQEARQGGEPLLMLGNFKYWRALVSYSPHHAPHTVWLLGETIKEQLLKQYC
ncbi:hypothetical protein CG392_04255 [Gardnerella vaginalis]|nr:hypothetical protein CG392_04255 [Gardnerella vaginalis]